MARGPVSLLHQVVQQQRAFIFTSSCDCSVQVHPSHGLTFRGSMMWRDNPAKTSRKPMDKNVEKTIGQKRRCRWCGVGCQMLAASVSR
jgi:hypothetical protein